MSGLPFKAGPALLPVLLTLAACAREPIFPSPAMTSRIISFDTTLTKSGESFTTGDSFLVWAVTEDGEEIMKGQKVTLTGDGWHYAPLKYWPAGKSITFYAASPGDPALFEYEEQMQRIYIYCPEDASCNILCSDYVTYGEGETVRLCFSHILSKISIRGKLRKAAPSSRSVRINRISFDSHPCSGVWETKNKRWQSSDPGKRISQDVDVFLHGEDPEPVTEFYMIPDPGGSPLNMEIEWEILYSATGETAVSRTSSVTLSNTSLCENTGIDFTLSLDGRLGLIDFADDETKRICVAAFDTDSDGEISYEEAAAVTDLGRIFRGSRITTFDELKWFTGLTTLPSYAFCDCESLVSLVIPETVTSVGNFVFSGCAALPRLVLPEQVDAFPDGLVDECSALTEISHGSNIRRIGEYAFAGCTALTHYDIPATVTEFGAYAFQESGLESIDLSNCTAPLSIGMFQGSSFLVEVRFNPTMELIPDLSFQRCTSLTELAFPSALKRIGSTSFEGCTALEKIDLPRTMESIGYSAFANCANVREIISRSSVAPNADSKAFGWIDENGVSHYAGSAVSGNKRFTRLKISTGYKKEPWSLLTGEAGFIAHGVYSFN